MGIGSANTPLGHAIILIPIQLLESQTGLSVNIMAYSAFGIVTGLLIFAALILVYRLLYRPDLNKLRHYDATRLRSDLQPMSVQEKISAVLFVVVIVIWLLQGFLKDIAPHRRRVYLCAGQCGACDGGHRDPLPDQGGRQAHYGL